MLELFLMILEFSPFFSLTFPIIVLLKLFPALESEFSLERMASGYGVSILEILCKFDFLPLNWSLAAYFRISFFLAFVRSTLLLFILLLPFRFVVL